MDNQPGKTIKFLASGRGRARCPPNPAYPDGIDVACEADRHVTRCLIDLPYPAPECGAWLVRCEVCGYAAAITAAGRPDDPRSVTLPCNSWGGPDARQGS